MLPLVIATHLGSFWVNWWINNRPHDRPVFLNWAGGYEPAALLLGMNHFPRFLLLQDSTRILHDDFWPTVDGLHATWLTGWPPMFMAVHDTSQLEPHRARIEACKTRADSIRLEADLPSLVNYDTLWPHITDRTAIRQEIRHGRNNLVLGNHLFEKHKGTWS